MASTQYLTQLRAYLTKCQRAYQNLVKKVDTRNEKYKEEILSMVFTKEQIACRKEAMNQLLATLYNMLCCFKETVQKIDEEARKLEGAANLLTLREEV